MRAQLTNLPVNLLAHFLADFPAPGCYAGSNIGQRLIDRPQTGAERLLERSQFPLHLLPPSCLCLPQVSYLRFKQADPRLLPVELILLPPDLILLPDDLIFLPDEYLLVAGTRLVLPGSLLFQRGRPLVPLLC